MRTSNAASPLSSRQTRTVVAVPSSHLGWVGLDLMTAILGTHGRFRQTLGACRASSWFLVVTKAFPRFGVGPSRSTPVFVCPPDGLGFVPITWRDRIALFDDVLSGGNWVTGLAIGVSTLMTYQLAAPILRPLAKTAINGGILAYQGAAGVFEGIGDLVAEAAAEVGQDTPPVSEAAPRNTGERRHLEVGLERK